MQLPLRFARPRPWLFLSIALAHGVALDALWRMTHPEWDSPLAQHGPALRTEVSLLAPEPAPAPDPLRGKRGAHAPTWRTTDLALPIDLAPGAPTSHVAQTAPEPAMASSAALQLDAGALREAARSAIRTDGVRQLIEAQDAQNSVRLSDKETALGRGMALSRRLHAHEMARALSEAAKREGCKAARAVGGDDGVAVGGIGGNVRQTFTLRRPQDCPP